MGEIFGVVPNACQCMKSSALSLASFRKNSEARVLWNRKRLYLLFHRWLLLGLLLTENRPGRHAKGNAGPWTRSSAGPITSCDQQGRDD